MAVHCFLCMKAMKKASRQEGREFEKNLPFNVSKTLKTFLMIVLCFECAQSNKQAGILNKLVRTLKLEIEKENETESFVSFSC